MSSIVLGIDPSFSSTGWVFLRCGDKYEVLDSGTIKNKVKKPKKGELPKPEGLSYAEYYNALSVLADNPLLKVCDAVAVEVNFSKIYGRGFSPKYFIACGIVSVFIHNLHSNVFEYSPNQTRRAVTGSGNADKDVVLRGVTNLCGVDVVSKLDEHQVDSIATIICYLKANLHIVDENVLGAGKAVKVRKKKAVII